MGNGLQMALAGGLTGLGDGLSTMQEQKQREAEMAQQRSDRFREMMLKREWQVEDRDLAYARRKGSGGGRRSSSSGGSAGSKGVGGGLVENADGTLSLDKSAPAATRNAYVEATAAARAAGRPGPTWADLAAVQNPDPQFTPQQYTTLLQSEVKTLRGDLRNRSLSDEELFGMARENVNRYTQSGQGGVSDPEMPSADVSSTPPAPMGPAGETAGGGAPATRIPSSAVAHLRANPDLAAQFDAKFGPGSAALYLNQ